MSGTARNRLARIFYPLFLILALAVPGTGVAAMAPAESARYAFLLGADEEATARLGDVLAYRYGYQVTDATGLSSLAAIEGAVLEVQDRVGPKDDILVFIGLPFIRRPELYFLPRGASPEEPWTLVSADYVSRRLVALSFGSGLWIYPSCAGEPRELYRELEPLLLGTNQPPLDLLLVCDLETMASSERRGMVPEQGEAAPRPVPWRTALVAELLSDLLEGPEASQQAVSSHDLAYALSAARKGFEAQAEQPRNRRGLPFELVATGSVEQYALRFAGARDLEELLAILDRFGSSARSDELVARGYLSFLVRLTWDGSGQTEAALGLEELVRLRISAVERLAGWSSPAGLDALGEVVELGSDDVRWRAVQQLIRSDLREKDREVLREALDDNSPRVRSAAVSGLSLQRDLPSLPIFRELAQDDPDIEVRLAAIQAVAFLGGEEAKPLLVQFLGDDEPRIRREAAHGLARLGPSEPATEALVARLREDADEEVRAAAATALGRTWTPQQRGEVLAALVEVLDGDPGGGGDSRTAVAVIGALSRVGGEVALQRLRSLLDQELPMPLRIAAIQGLYRVGPDDALDELAAAAASEEPSLRLAAVAALSGAESNRALKILVSRLDDPDSYVRAEAERSMRKIDPSGERTAALIQDPEQELTLIYSQDGKVPTPMAPDTQTNFWIESLGAENVRLRRAAVDALAISSDPTVVDRLTHVLLTGDVLARQNAAAALGGRPEGEKESLKLLVAALQDVNSAVRVAVVKALGRRTEAAALVLVIRATDDDSADVRRAAVEVLGASSDQPEARAALERLAKEDESSLVRESAVQQLVRRDLGRAQQRE
ncbi:MAG: HEAT repeat domain-containing protein [Acidobacteriota bacterium]|nr:HEAT repeat domain-containing protein [Acidobacteriota bacterium]